MPNNKMTAWPLELGAGSAAAPSEGFGDAGTGLFRSAANEVAVSFSGNQRIRLLATGVSCQNNTAQWVYSGRRFGGTDSAMTATSDGNVLCALRGAGHTGAAFSTSGGEVRITQDGAPSGAYVPTKVQLVGYSSGGSLTVGLEVSSVGAVSILKGATLGGAATDVIACTGRFKPRQIASTTSQPGVEGEIVYCTGDDKSYTCTASSETAATWAAHY